MPVKSKYNMSIPKKPQVKEYDVHFNLHGFFRKIEANTSEKAMTIAEEWLTKALPDLEKAARVGLSIEITETVNPE